MLVRKVFSHSSSDMSPMSLNVAWWAALLTRMSMPPSSSTAFLMIVAAMLRILQVAGHHDCLPAFLLDEFLDLVRLFGLIEKSDQDVCAFACECDRDRPAYAAVSTGDDGLHALQLTRALVAGLAMIRTGLHRSC